VWQDVISSEEEIRRSVVEYDVTGGVARCFDHLELAGTNLDGHSAEQPIIGSSPGAQLDVMAGIRRVLQGVE
jgi:hypothetical protein